MASNDDIMHAIARLEAGMDAVGVGESLGHLRNDFIDEKDHAHESRAVIHQRLDLQG
jgi:hypothetical protein